MLGRQEGTWGQQFAISSWKVRDNGGQGDRFMKLGPPPCAGLEHLPQGWGVVSKRTLRVWLGWRTDADTGDSSGKPQVKSPKCQAEGLSGDSRLSGRGRGSELRCRNSSLAARRQEGHKETRAQPCGGRSGLDHGGGEEPTSTQNGAPSSTNTRLAESPPPETPPTYTAHRHPEKDKQLNQRTGARSFWKDQGVQIPPEGDSKARDQQMSHRNSRAPCQLCYHVGRTASRSRH